MRRELPRIDVPTRFAANQDHFKDAIKLRQTYEQYNLVDQNRKPLDKNLPHKERQLLERNLVQQNLDFREEVPKWSLINPRIHPNYSALKT